MLHTWFALTLPASSHTILNWVFALQHWNAKVQVHPEAFNLRVLGQSKTLWRPLPCPGLFQSVCQLWGRLHLGDLGGQHAFGLQKAQALWRVPGSPTQEEKSGRSLEVYSWRLGTQEPPEARGSHQECGLQEGSLPS